MARKKQDTFDEAKEQGTTLADFIIPQRVTAFADHYQPTQEGCHSDTFNETRLRDFFKAWPCSLGDPLAWYLQLLEGHGFRLTVGFDGELTIFVTTRNVSSQILSLSQQEEPPLP